EKLKMYFLDKPNFDTRALKRDIRALDDNGFEVIVNEGRFGKNLYSHQGRLFETYQLRLLSDAVLSARFITETDKQSIVKKIKKSLPDTLIFNPYTNIEYNFIKINIDKVHEAVSNNNVIEYQYGKYNIHKDFTLNRDGEIYETEPYALIWRNDYYYLIGRYL